MLPLLEANADQIMLKFFPKFKRGLTDDVFCTKSLISKIENSIKIIDDFLCKLYIQINKGSMSLQTFWFMAVSEE